MLNIIFTIFILPFIPLFFYGNVFNESDFLDVSSSVRRVVKGQEVLGESRGGKDFPKNAEETFQSCNLFPLDSANTEYTPIRKKNFWDLKLWAGSSVVIDVDSGTILHYDNGRKKTQIASLTKMMTAILVMDEIKNLDETVVITEEALNVPGTVVGCPRTGYCLSNRMYRGEKIKAGDLLRAMLLNSANDAATALGIHIAGTEKKFVEKMNEKARSLGLKDTNFCTPSGLEIDGQEDQCHSSAYDIARIAAHSLKYEEIWDIMRIPEGQFYSTDGKYMHELKNTDLLLDSIPNCLGGKTGFTPLAGKSLLMGSVDPTGKHRVISVILNDENRWEDMRKLVDWVFENYEWR
ncbi:MAG TPA: D-alanyl-D-alanine carboxypeptidase family protein [Candidatus Moranbacteria bacterium]|nr:D-alanyl-D-alanine carboxypeptidase family protein [Candidatus Moranbacteria bacterium]